MAPTAEAGTSFLLVKWEPPGMPNGIVTGYFLYKDGVKVYTGGGYSFNITGLQVEIQTVKDEYLTKICWNFYTEKNDYKWREHWGFFSPRLFWFIYIFSNERNSAPVHFPDATFNLSLLLTITNHVINDCRSWDVTVWDLYFWQVYTGYQITVRACTRVGCSDGPPTTLSTAQLPPKFMEAPYLVVLGMIDMVEILCLISFQSPRLPNLGCKPINCSMHV